MPTRRDRWYEQTESLPKCSRDRAGRVMVQTGDVGVLAADLAGPVGLELARAVEQSPGEHAMPGGSRFELKWDGFHF
jgi:hypothetical protein